MPSPLNVATGLAPAMAKPALPFPAKQSAATADTRHPIVAEAVGRWTRKRSRRYPASVCATAKPMLEITRRLRLGAQLVDAAGKTAAQISSAETNFVNTGGAARNEARLVWPSPARQAR